MIPIEQVGDGQAFVAQVGEADLRAARRRRRSRLIVIVCVLGSLGAMLMLAPRVYFAMAQDGLFPAAAAAVHPRFGTPARAIAIAGGARVRARRPRARSTRSSPTSSSSPSCSSRATVGSVFVLATPRSRRSRFPGYPWTPAASFSRWSRVLLVLLALNNPVAGAARARSWSRAALPVYQLIRRRTARRPAFKEMVAMTWIRVDSVRRRRDAARRRARRSSALYPIEYAHADPSAARRDRRDRRARTR